MFDFMMYAVIFCAVGIAVAIAVAIALTIRRKKRQTSNTLKGSAHKAITDNSAEEKLPSKEDMLDIMTIFECLDEIYKTD